MPNFHEYKSKVINNKRKFAFRILLTLSTAFGMINIHPDSYSYSILKKTGQLKV